MFLNWASEDVILGVLKNWQKFSAWVMDYKPECLVAEDMFWYETEYRSNFNVKPLEMHHTAGPQA